MEKGKYDYKSGNMLIKPTDEEDVWNSKWDIYLVEKGDHTKVGWFSFEGEKETGTVPIQIELLPLYRGRGLGTNALKMAREWAFLHRDVYEIEAFADRENSEYISALQKSGFIYREDATIFKNQNERYSVVRPKTVWTGIYIVIGVFVGVALGIVISIPWVGLVIGLGIALALGTYMDSSERRHRRDITGNKFDKYKTKGK
ncbi:MAG: GNAT family N-acetyltransferase [Saccharofermentans sp.]|nr:GNAT family N-acetyltransferase [Saccharofermentans sp.]